MPHTIADLEANRAKLERKRQLFNTLVQELLKEPCFKDWTCDTSDIMCHAQLQHANGATLNIFSNGGIHLSLPTRDAADVLTAEHVNLVLVVTRSIADHQF